MNIRKKPHYVIFKIFDMKVESSYITGKMLWKDFNESVSKEKPKTPYMIIHEDGIDIFYINSPVGCYRITLIKEE